MINRDNAHSPARWWLLALAGLCLGMSPALAVDHSGTITVSEIWTAADNPHNVVGSVTVNAGVTLTIAPGAEVFFNANTRITVYGDLAAVGTSGNGITFTRSATGAWYGLRFLTAGDGALAYCSIDNATYGVDKGSSGTVSVAHSTFQQCTYGIRATAGDVDLTSVTMNGNTSFGFHGNGVAPDFLDGNSEFIDCGTGVHVQAVDNLMFVTPLAIRDNTTVGLSIDSCDDPTIDNIVFTGNSGPNGAMLLTDTGDYALGAGNTIGGPGDENAWPVTVTMGSYATAASVIPTSGNDTDAIQVVAGSSTRTGIWRDFPGLDYIVTASPTIAAVGDLTIEDGVTVIFDSNDRINVYGELHAVGTTGSGIVFTRRGAVTWYGLRFLTAGSGEFAHCTLEYASYGVDMASSATVSLASTVIHDCTYGVRATDGDIELTSVSMLDNTSYGFSGNGVAPTLLDANCEFVDCGIGVFVQNVPGLSLTSAMSIRDNTTVGLSINDCNGPTIDNITLTGNSGPNGALLLTDTGVVTLGAGNTIGGPGDENTWPVTITMGSYPAAGSVIPATGNETNDIQVIGGASTRTGTWFLIPGLDYVVTGSPSISAAGELTIADGVRVVFDSNDRINIYGELVAVGTGGAGIEFTRRGTATWYGLRFLTAGHGTLQHCDIEHASFGIDLASSGTVDVANTTIHNCTNGVRATNGDIRLASVSIFDNTSSGFHGNGVAPELLDTACEFVDSGTGVLIQAVADLQFTTAVSIRDNTTAGLSIQNCDDAVIDNVSLLNNSGANGAIVLTDTGEFTLGAGNTIGGFGNENTWPMTITMGSFPAEDSVIPAAGNDNDAIQVIGGSSSRTGTWHKFTGLDYVVTGNPSIAAAGALTIADEVTMEFDSGDRINVYGDLTARATTVGGITFTRRGTATWYGLRFLTAGRGDIDLCNIEYASYGIDASGSGSVDISRTTIRNCNYGVRASNGTISFTNDRILDNTSYGVYLNGATPVFGSSVTQWNDILDNGTGQSGRDLRNGPFDIDAHHVWWGTVSAAGIEDRIEHEPDNASLGLVDWDPASTEGHEIVVTGVDDPPGGSDVPQRFAFYQNHPNPFNAMTTIRFDLARPAHVRLDIHDLAGARVARLVDELLPARAHQVIWRGQDSGGRTVSSGVYFYRIDTGDRVETRRMVMVK